MEVEEEGEERECWVRFLMVKGDAAGRGMTTMSRVAQEGTMTSMMAPRRGG